ncbi:MAG: iron ABC transporter permease [Verrucomicrobiota bacterium]
MALNPATTAKNLLATPGLTAGRFVAWTFGLLLLAPVVFTLLALVTSQGGESWSHVREYTLGPAVRSSLILVIFTGLFSTLFGLPAAWCVTHYNFPGRKLLSVLLVLPLAIPPYIAAYVTTEAREAAIPLLISIREDHGVDAYLRAEVFHRYAWLVIMMASVLFPYIFLSCRAVFASQARHLAEAGRLLGASPWRTFRTIHLPLIRPALIAGLFLVSMEVLSDYGAAKHLGMPTLTVTIFRTWFGLDELETARYLSSWVLAAIFLVLLLERWQRGRARFAARRNPLPRTSLKVRGTVLAWLVCGLPVALGLLFPIFTLLDWHFTSTQTIPFAELLPSLRQTLLIGLLVTAACLLLALLVLATARFAKSKQDRFLTTTLFTAGYASPSTIMAVGVLGLAALAREAFPAQSWLGPLLLSGSLLWLAFALTARYLTVAGQVLSAGFAAIPPSYDHAARTLGRKLANIFRTIHLPLLRAPLLGAAVLVFVDVTKELPLTLLLRPFDFETLGTTAYSSVNQGRILECAAPSLLLIALSCTGLLLVELTGWTRNHSSKNKRTD